MPNITRQKLYDKVWSTPIELLAKDYGMSGRGLSKLCKRYEIPTPPRGYWAKIQAGQAPTMTPLPKPAKDVPHQIRIADKRAFKEVARKNKQAIEEARPAAAKRISSVTVPDDLRNLHWIVAGWVKNHKKAHAEALIRVRDRERARRKVKTNADHIDFLFMSNWKGDAEIDFTERDKYRLCMTSAFLKCFEGNGGKAIEGKLNGELKVSCSGHEIELLIKEKMRQDYRKPSKHDEKWTAYPSHHNSSLRPSGFIRFQVKTYIGSGVKSQWIETKKHNGGDFIASVVGEVLDLGPVLIRQEVEAKERQRQFLIEQEKRFEAQRLAQLDAERWRQFKAMSTDWDEAQRLRRFLGELRKRKDSLRTTEEGLSVEEYISWANRKIAELDPLTTSENEETDRGL